MAHQCPHWCYPQDVQPQELREEQWIKLQADKDEDGWAESRRRLVDCEPSQEQKASLGNITSIHPQLSIQPTNSLWALVSARNYSRYSESGAGKHYSAPFFKTFLLPIPCSALSSTQDTRYLFGLSENQIFLALEWVEYGSPIWLVQCLLYPLKVSGFYQSQQPQCDERLWIYIFISITRKANCLKHGTGRILCLGDSKNHLPGPVSLSPLLLAHGL